MAALPFNDQDAADWGQYFANRSPIIWENPERDNNGEEEEEEEYDALAEAQTMQDRQQLQELKQEQDRLALEAAKEAAEKARRAQSAQSAARDTAAKKRKEDRAKWAAAYDKTHASLEAILLQTYLPKPAKPEADTKPRYDRFIALNPAQQPLVNFLQQPHGELRPSWRAQLCIPPLGVKPEEPEPKVSRVVKVAEIRPAVLQWSSTDDEYLHLVVENKLNLTFKRCVYSDALVDLDVPFRTLYTALVDDVTEFQRAQTQFAEFGIALTGRV
jgi:hypothetical protein